MNLIINGIFSIGEIKPEIIKDGTINAKTPKIACCCDLHILDINNPIPDIDNKKIVVTIKIVNTEDITGTLKIKTPDIIIIILTASAKTIAGIVLPINISVGCNGDTIV